MMLSGLRWTFLCDVLRLGKCNEKVWSGDMSLNLALWDKAIQRKQGSTQVAGWTISWPWPQLNLAPSGQKSTHFAKLIALNMPTVPLKTNEVGSLINHPGQLTRRHMASVHWWPIIWPILKLMRCTVRLGMPLCTNLAVFFLNCSKRLWLLPLLNIWQTISGELLRILQFFLSDPSPIIGNTCHSLPKRLTPSCLVNLIDVTLACEGTYSKLVEVVTVPDVDDEDRVGNSLLQI